VTRPAARLPSVGPMVLLRRAGSAAAAVLLLPLATYNLLYGVVVDDYRTAWGGPSLAGAWAVHGSAGLAMALLAAWLLRRGWGHR
jgi:hypothetical protein